jgi:hypothetical protein
MRISEAALDIIYDNVKCTNRSLHDVFEREHRFYCGLKFDFKPYLELVRKGLINEFSIKLENNEYILTYRYSDLALKYIETDESWVLEYSNP